MNLNSVWKSNCERRAIKKMKTDRADVIRCDEAQFKHKRVLPFAAESQLQDSFDVNGYYCTNRNYVAEVYENSE